MRCRHLPILPLACLLLLWNGLFGQYELVLEKPGAFKRMRIAPGKEIGIRVKGSDVVFVGELRGVKQDRIFMFGDSIHPDSVARILLPQNKPLINMLRKSLIGTALFYPAMLIINLQPSNWTWERAGEVAAVSSGALSSQLAMRRLYWRRYNLEKGKWRLRVRPKVESLI